MQQPGTGWSPCRLASMRTPLSFVAAMQRDRKEMTLINTYDFPGFEGISVQAPQSMPNRETFALNVWECLKQIRRLPSGAILLNQIKLARPLAVSPRNSPSEVIRLLQFDIRTMVIIYPIEIEYVQSGYMMFGGMMPSSARDHNPDAPFWRRGTGASTEALDLDAAGQMHRGSKAVIRFSNAIMSSGLSTPPFIVLAHELIHAQHYLWGVRYDAKEDEENRTTGVGKFRGAMEPMVSENRLRREAGLPERLAYTR